MDNLYYKNYRLVPKEQWRWLHFRPAEIACKGTGQILIVLEALDALENLRCRLGVPITINSAYRSPEHNHKIGGAPNSNHVKGIAFDIKLTAQFTREKLKEEAKKCGFKGFGDYDTFVHIDLGRERAWDFRKNVLQ
jgi:uncharacterized protein YcbK (DUF882 family)